MNLQVSSDKLQAIKEDLLRRYLFRNPIYEDNSPEVKCLHDTINPLLNSGAISLNKKGYYQLSPLGTTEIDNVTLLLGQLLNIYNIYSSIDLNTGEFGYSHLPEFLEISEFRKFLNQPRWSDLRLQVCEFFEKDDVVDLLYAIKRDNVDWYDNDWQYKRFLMNEFPEITDSICSAVSWRDFGDNEEHAKSIFEDIVFKAQEIEANMRKQIYG